MLAYALYKEEGFQRGSCAGIEMLGRIGLFIPTRLKRLAT